MTYDELRTLLTEHVADETGPDLASDAWASGRRRSRRRTAAALAGGCAAVLVVTGGVALGTRGPSPAPSPLGPAGQGASQDPSQDPSQGAGQGATPDASQGTTSAGQTAARPGSRYEGSQTWWFGDVASETDVAFLDGTGLPRTIDLSEGAPAAVDVGPVVGLVAVVPDGPVSRVVALTAAGESRSVGITGLARVSDEGGNLLAPVVSDSLSPDGSRAFFIQERSLKIYEFATGDWTTIDTPAFLAEGASWITSTEIWVPDRLGAFEGTSYDLVTGRQSDAFVKSVSGPDWRGGEGFGPVVGTDRSVAQGVFLTDTATGPDGRSYNGLDAVAARLRDTTVLLVLGAEGDRWKGCCPVVGFVDDTVLFESRADESRVLAWDLGTERVRQVASIIGWTPGEESYVASWRIPLS